MSFTYGCPSEPAPCVIPQPSNTFEPQNFNPMPHSSAHFTYPPLFHVPIFAPPAITHSPNLGSNHHNLIRIIDITHWRIHIGFKVCISFQIASNPRAIVISNRKFATHAFVNLKPQPNLPQNIQETSQPIHTIMIIRALCRVLDAGISIIRFVPFISKK